jgi:hypothetical protein
MEYGQEFYDTIRDQSLCELEYQLNRRVETLDRLYNSITKLVQRLPYSNYQTFVTQYDNLLFKMRQYRLLRHESQLLVRHIERCQSGADTDE